MSDLHSIARFGVPGLPSAGQEDLVFHQRRLSGLIPEIQSVGSNFLLTAESENAGDSSLPGDLARRAQEDLNRLQHFEDSIRKARKVLNEVRCFVLPPREDVAALTEARRGEIRSFLRRLTLEERLEAIDQAFADNDVAVIDVVTSQPDIIGLFPRRQHLRNLRQSADKRRDPELLEAASSLESTISRAREVLASVRQTILDLSGVGGSTVYDALYEDEIEGCDRPDPDPFPWPLSSETEEPEGEPLVTSDPPDSDVMMTTSLQQDQSGPESGGGGQGGNGGNQGGGNFGGNN